MVMLSMVQCDVCFFGITVHMDVVLAWNVENRNNERNGTLKGIFSLLIDFPSPVHRRTGQYRSRPLKVIQIVGRKDISILKFESLHGFITGLQGHNIPASLPASSSIIACRQNLQSTIVNPSRHLNGSKAATTYRADWKTPSLQAQ
ncbi:hypothetical protein D1P53_006313 [Cryptococcus gattii VGV]|nr:hypothetical protein D1P53_006313 [Cryptococcus gattii VGV]